MAGFQDERLSMLSSDSGQSRVRVHQFCQQHWIADPGRQLQRLA